MSSWVVIREFCIGSEHTIIDWYTFAKGVWLDIIQKDYKQIDGDGKQIEIDESKFR